MKQSKLLSLYSISKNVGCNKIRARQREGIEAAKKKNVRSGRPSTPLPDNWREVMAEVRCVNKKPVEAMRELGISKSCYYRLYNKT